MINSEELNQILENLPFIIERDNSADYDLSEDVSSIVYYINIFKCGNSDVVSRHIDIEFIFGDYFEPGCPFIHLIQQRFITFRRCCNFIFPM